MRSWRTSAPTPWAASEGGGAPEELLLTWKSLSVQRRSGAGARRRHLRLSVQETALGDFFARVIVYPDGRINLQNLLQARHPGRIGRGAAAPACQRAGGSGWSPSAASFRCPRLASATGLEPVIASASQPDQRAGVRFRTGS